MNMNANIDEEKIAIIVILFAPISSIMMRWYTFSKLYTCIKSLRKRMRSAQSVNSI